VELERLSQLCESCALCCDGSLFGRVALDPEEIGPARRNRLRVIESGHMFEQPCAMLAAPGADARRACTIYDERPRSCRRFACRLYDRHQREGGSLEPRLAAVRRVRELVAYLEASGLQPADFDDDAARGRGPDFARAKEAFLELTRRLEDDFSERIIPEPGDPGAIPSSD
jgi:Fe-S-cluster containining protein